MPLKSTIMLASIDGCHVGPRFDHDFKGDTSVQEVVQTWEKKLWTLARSDKLEFFFQHAAHIENAFYFDGLGVLTLLFQHFELKSVVTTRDLWFQESDQSFVTFSGGWFDNLAPAGTNS
jgi:MEMO1 family protein